MTELGAIIFMGFFMLLPHIIKTSPTEIIDKVEIIQNIKTLPINQKQKNKKSKPKPKENKLLNDAIQCLTSLGMKKPDAKKKAEEMFAVKNYESIESFLLDVYKK